jgi:hypothetical protein
MVIFIIALAVLLGLLVLLAVQLIQAGLVKRAEQAAKQPKQAARTK